MKQVWIGLLTAGLIIVGLTSCQSNESDKRSSSDTALRTSSDTTVIPGTPGPAGTEPKPGDTSRTQNDSSKQGGHTSDSSGRSSATPK